MGIVLLFLCLSIGTLHGMETIENENENEKKEESASLSNDEQEKLNRNLLKYAKLHDHVGIMQFLCAGADKTITDDSGTSLHDIIYHATDEEGRRIYTSSTEGTDLIDGCLDALKSYPEALISCFDKIDNGNTPYISSCRWLSLGKINGVDYKNDNAIHRALRHSSNGDVTIKNFIGLSGWLNTYPSGIDQQNDDGDTPLHLVMKTERDAKSRRRLCLLLVSRDADAGIQNKEGKSPITMDPLFWMKLLDYGNSKSMSTKKGWLPTCAIS